MFKTLLRTLSALSIVTIGLTIGLTITANASFAQIVDPDCDLQVNRFHRECILTPSTQPVTTETWLDSFETETPALATTTATTAVKKTNLCSLV